MFVVMVNCIGRIFACYFSNIYINIECCIIFHSGGNDNDGNVTEGGMITVGLVECWDSFLINGIVP